MGDLIVVYSEYFGEHGTPAGRRATTVAIDDCGNKRILRYQKLAFNDGHPPLSPINAIGY